MSNIINYRGFQLQVSLDIPNQYIVGEVVPNENFKDLKFWEAEDSFSFLIEKFENYISIFLEEKRELFVYKNVTLEITKARGSGWSGCSDYFTYFKETTLDDLKRKFINDVDTLEESARVWNELQNKGS